MSEPSPAVSRSLAMEVVALAAILQALFLAVVAVVFVLPDLGRIVSSELPRLLLLPLLILASLAVAFLVLRWPMASSLAFFWPLAALPSLVMVLGFGGVFNNGLVHPQRLADFAPAVAANLIPLVLFVAAAIAFIEVRRGTVLRLAPGSGRGRLLAYGAPLAAVVIATLAISPVAAAVQSRQQLGPQAPGPIASPQGGGLAAPNAVGATVSQVAKGTVPALPDGTLYINISGLDSGAPAQEPGIEFDPGSSSGTFELNGLPGPPAKGALFLSARLTGQRSSAPGTSVYATDDLPPLPRINQVEALNLVKLAPKGRSARLTSHGVEVLYVLSGTVTVNAGTLPPNTVLAHGRGAFVLDNTGVQVVNTGSGTAAYLAFFLVRDGNNLESAGG